VGLRVFADVERQHDRGAEAAGHSFDALLEFLALVTEGESGAFAVHGLGNAVGDRAIARKTDDDGAFTGQEPHDRCLEASGRDELRSFAW
jgi:hypothetical protein